MTVHVSLQHAAMGTCCSCMTASVQGASSILTVVQKQLGAHGGCVLCVQSGIAAQAALSYHCT
jgi:hypothetical protein